MTEKELMLAGELYFSRDAELMEDCRRSRQLTRLFNSTTEEQLEYRTELLKKLFKKTGENIYIEPPFRCDYGCNITIGDDFYANFDCIILDVAEVFIGNNVLLAPRVCIYTVGHPTDVHVRNMFIESGQKVFIGNNVWIGGNTVINPGVKIGDNTVIGSGSVVTHNIPENVIAAGNPCRALREISEEEKQYWRKKLEKRKQLLAQ